MPFNAESQGIDFILRFQDMASEAISSAEQSYRRLVSSMQNVIDTDRALTNTLTDSITSIANQISKTPYPLVTPLTISPDQIGLIGQFEQATVSWYQNLISQLSLYTGRIRQSVTGTESLRKSVLGLVTDFKGYMGSLKELYPYLQQFAQFKFEGLKTGSLRRFVTDLQSLVKDFMTMSKLSPEFRKQMGLNDTVVHNLGQSTDQLANATQKANFHQKDLTDQLKRSADNADKARKPFMSLLDSLGKLSDVKYAVMGGISGIMMNKYVQQFSSLEDAALAVRVRMGEASGSIDDIVQKYRKLSLESGYLALEVGGAFSRIVEKSGRLSKMTDMLAITSTSLGKLTNAAPEMVGSVAGSLLGMYQLSEKQADAILKMSYAAQQGAKNMQAVDFLTPFVDKFQMFEGAAKEARVSLNQFLMQNAPAIMAMQKALTNVYGSAEMAHKSIEGLSNALTDDAKQMMAITAFGRQNYYQMRDLLKQGRMDDVYSIMIQSAKRLANESDAMYNERLQAFSQASGMQADSIRDLARVSESTLRQYTTELKNATQIEKAFNNMVKERQSTFTGMYEDIRVVWEYITSGIGRAMSVTIGPLIHGLANIAKYANSIPIVGAGIQTIVGGLSMFLGFRGLVSVLELIFGKSSILARMGSLSRFFNFGGAAASTGILASLVTKIKSVSGAAREAAMEMMGISRTPKQMSFAFEAGESIAARGSMLGKIFGEGFMASSMRSIAGLAARLPLAGIVGRIAGRFVPVLGWSLVAVDISKAVIALDGWLEKQGKVGAAMRALMAPFTGLAHVIAGLGHVIWESAKKMINGEGILGKFAQTLSMLTGPAGLTVEILTKMTKILNDPTFLGPVMNVIERINKAFDDMNNKIDEFFGTRRAPEIVFKQQAMPSPPVNQADKMYRSMMQESWQQHGFEKPMRVNPLPQADSPEPVVVKPVVYAQHSGSTDVSAIAAAMAQNMRYPKPEVHVDSQDDQIVNELRGIGMVVRQAISVLASRRIPQEIPAFNSKFGALARSEA